MSYPYPPMYDPTVTRPSCLPAFASNATGSRNVDTDLWEDGEALVHRDSDGMMGSWGVNTDPWEDEVVLVNRDSDGMIDCDQTTLSLPPPLAARVNDPLGTPGSVNDPLLRGFPTINAINLYHPNASLGLVTPEQQTVTLGPSTDRELQIPRPHPQTWPAQRQLLGCIIPGCSRQFHRSDALGNHLRKKHLLPIPKGQWAKSWISRVENHHYYNAAVQAQLRENSGV